jgi:hypothetical protein
MLHAGLDLSRDRLDVCPLSEHCEVLEQFAAPSDLDGRLGAARRRYATLRPGGRPRDVPSRTPEAGHRDASPQAPTGTRASAQRRSSFADAGSNRGSKMSGFAGLRAGRS